MIIIILNSNCKTHTKKNLWLPKIVPIDLPNGLDMLDVLLQKVS